MIESVAARGYRLSAQSNRLSRLMLPAEYCEPGRNIEVYDVIDSTNNAAKGETPVLPTVL